MIRTSGGTFATLDSWFPVPKLLAPPAVGIDVSDTSVKWLELQPTTFGSRVGSWGEVVLEPGILENGVIKKDQALAAALGSVKNTCGASFAHAALPEESAYVFSMQVPPASTREQILNLIEFELSGRVPIAPAAAVFDYDIITENETHGREVAVTVFPRELAQSYAAVFASAGIQLLSLEVEARSVSRALCDSGKEQPITLLVDFGRARTGFAVLKKGIPIFTSTVAVGGEAMLHAVMDKLSLSEPDALHFNNEQGLLPEGGVKSPGLDALMGVASALADEVVRHFHYWDTRRDEHGGRLTPVEQVYLVGGSSNLRGLADYIASRVQAPAIRPDVWRHICSFDDYIPPIDRRGSLQYATAIGLALRGI